MPGSTWSSSARKTGRIVSASRCQSVQNTYRLNEKAAHHEPASWLCALQASPSIVTFGIASTPIASLSSPPPHTHSSSRAPAAKDLGISCLSFSPSGAFLAASTAASPERVLLLGFIRSSEALPFTALRPRICSIILCNKAVVACVWRPPRSRLPCHTEAEGDLEGECLAIATGEKSVLMWTESPSEDDEEDEQGPEPEAQIKPGVMEGIGVPSTTTTTFEASDIRWSIDGSCIVLSGSDKFCLAYPLPSGQSGQ